MNEIIGAMGLLAVLAVFGVFIYGVYIISKPHAFQLHK